MDEQPKLRRSKRKTTSYLFHDHDWSEDEAEEEEEEEEEEERPPAKPKVEVEAHDDYCFVCASVGELLCCDTCQRVFHLACLVPPLAAIPDGDWYCRYCLEEEQKERENMRATKKRRIDEKAKKENEPSIESILWCRTKEEKNKQGDGPALEYYVKWRGRSHMHCEWLSTEEVMYLSSQKLRNFNKKGLCTEEDPNFGVNPSWLNIARIINHRKEGSSKEYLVKWGKLAHEHCTWEKEADIQNKPEFREALKKYKQFDDYEEIYRCRQRFLKNGRKARAGKSGKTYEEHPTFLGGVLHDYQLEGLNWLLYSWCNNTNVILADEMGLGKTIQTIAFLKSLMCGWSCRGPFLLVVPLSTIKNWTREWHVWAPDMNVVEYIGTPESRRVIRENEFYFSSSQASKKIFKFNALITSYDMIRQDWKVLKQPHWEMLVVDEAHSLKNNASKLFQSLSSFKTENRLLLTGTPLQNNLQELFHLLHFLTPGRFDSLASFEEEFTCYEKKDTIDKLHKLLAPHMLRRVKADVLKIPPKSEVIVSVKLTALQKEFYRTILTKNYELLKGSLKGTSLINIVCQLQKCCNHPYLFNNTEPHTLTDEETLSHLINASGKLIIMDKMLEKLKEQGHRVLIFSQMTRVLDILEDYCYYKEYKYERIDGSITGTSRQQRIDRFNEPGSDVFLFLLSTRAGGLGINLATADTVFIYDSDWNPHNDIQALSRAHRIGQESKVMIYRLITRGSVEERVMQKAKEKLMLDHLVVQKMNYKGESLFKEGELDSILRFGATGVFEECDDQNDITYDDQAIEELLDRSKVGVEIGETPQEQYLKTFKVAQFGNDNEEKEMEVSKDEEDEEDFWTKLLKKRYEEDLKTEEAEMGKGKRSKRKVKYCELYGEESVGNDKWKGKKHGKRGPPIRTTGKYKDASQTKPPRKKRRTSLELNGRRRSKRRLRRSGEPPLLEGTGAKLKVLGFNVNERKAFLRMFMAFGLPNVGSWKDHFVKHITRGGLKRKTDEEVIRYGRLFIKHLMEDIKLGDRTYSDGVPIEGSTTHQDILSKISILHLIQERVDRILKDKEKPLTIDERGFTELSYMWANSVFWTSEHDKKLLVGIVKHGYARWSDILHDKEHELLKVVYGELAKRKGHLDAEKYIRDKNKKYSNKPFSDSAVNAFLRKRLCALEKALSIEAHLKKVDAVAPPQGNGETSTHNPSPHPVLSPASLSSHFQASAFKNPTFTSSQFQKQPILPAPNAHQLNSSLLSRPKVLLPTNPSTTSNATNLASPSGQKLFHLTARGPPNPSTYVPGSNPFLQPPPLLTSSNSASSPSPMCAWPPSLLYAFQQAQHKLMQGLPPLQPKPPQPNNSLNGSPNTQKISNLHIKPQSSQKLHPKQQNGYPQPNLQVTQASQQSPDQKQLNSDQQGHQDQQPKLQSQLQESLDSQMGSSTAKTNSNKQLSVQTNQQDEQKEEQQSQSQKQLGKVQSVAQNQQLQSNGLSQHNEQQPVPTTQFLQRQYQLFMEKQLSMLPQHHWVYQLTQQQLAQKPPTTSQQQAAQQAVQQAAQQAAQQVQQAQQPQQQQQRQAINGVEEKEKKLPFETEDILETREEKENTKQNETSKKGERVKGRGRGRGRGRGGRKRGGTLRRSKSTSSLPSSCFPSSLFSPSPSSSCLPASLFSLSSTPHSVLTSSFPTSPLFTSPTAISTVTPSYSSSSSIWSSASSSSQSVPSLAFGRSVSVPSFSYSSSSTSSSLPQKFSHSKSSSSSSLSSFPASSTPFSSSSVASYSSSPSLSSILPRPSRTQSSSSVTSSFSSSNSAFSKPSSIRKTPILPSPTSLISTSVSTDPKNSSKQPVEDLGFQRERYEFFSHFKKLHSFAQSLSKDPAELSEELPKMKEHIDNAYNGLLNIEKKMHQQSKIQK